MRASPLSAVALVCVCALVLPPSHPALAQAPPAASASARMKEVKKACAAGDVERGIRLLADLYAETNDPTAIYNQGRCYQQNAEPERAASRFREYLRKAPGIAAAERAEVEGFIREADAEAAVRAQRAAQAAAAATPPTPAAPAPAPAAAPPPAWAPGYAQAPAYTPAPAPAAPPPVRAGRRKGLMIAGLITLGASYALTALVGSALTQADDKDCSNCKAVGEAFYVPVFGPWMVYRDEADGGAQFDNLLENKKRTDLNALALLAGGAQGVGAVLATIGIAVFASSGKSTEVAAVPLFTALPGGGLAALRGRY